MNTELPPDSRAELEARVTAMLLGELTADEAAALREIITHDADLAKLHDQLRLTLDLVRETAATPVGEMAAQPVPLRLSPARREALLAQFKTVEMPQVAQPQAGRRSWVVPLAVAATIILMATVLFGPKLDLYYRQEDRAENWKMEVPPFLADAVGRRVTQVQDAGADSKEGSLQGGPPHTGLPRAESYVTINGKTASDVPASSSSYNGIIQATPRTAPVPYDANATANRLFTSVSRPTQEAVAEKPTTILYSTNSLAANNIYVPGNTTDEGKDSAPNFRGVPVDSALKYMADSEGLTIIRDTETRSVGNVDLVSQYPLSKNEKVALLNKSLSKDGLAAVPDGKNLEIMTIEAAKLNEGTQVVVVGGSYTNIPQDSTVVTEIIPLHSLNSTQVTKELFAAKAPGVEINDEGGNAISVTAPRSEVRRLTKSIQELDKPGARDLRVFSLTNANSKEVAQELNDVFSIEQPKDGAGNPVASIFGRGRRTDTEANVGHPAPKANVVYDAQNNSVIVSAPQDIMPGIESLIAKNDQGPARKVLVYQYHPQYSDALDMQQPLQYLFAANTDRSTATNVSALQTRAKQAAQSSTFSSSSSQLGLADNDFGTASERNDDSKLMDTGKLAKSVEPEGVYSLNGVGYLNANADGYAKVNGGLTNAPANIIGTTFINSGTIDSVTPFNNGLGRSDGDKRDLAANAAGRGNLSFRHYDGPDQSVPWAQSVAGSSLGATTLTASSVQDGFVVNNGWGYTGYTNYFEDGGDHAPPVPTQFASVTNDGTAGKVGWNWNLGSTLMNAEVKPELELRQEEEKRLAGLARVDNSIGGGGFGGGGGGRSGGGTSASVGYVPNGQSGTIQFTVDPVSSSLIYMTDETNNESLVKALAASDAAPKPEYAGRVGRHPEDKSGLFPFEAAQFASSQLASADSTGRARLAPGAQEPQKGAQRDLAAANKTAPALGDVPLLGTLFNRKDDVQDEGPDFQTATSAPATPGAMPVPSQKVWDLAAEMDSEPNHPNSVYLPGAEASKKKEADVDLYVSSAGNSSAAAFSAPSNVYDLYWGQPGEKPQSAGPSPAISHLAANGQLGEKPQSAASTQTPPLAEHGTHDVGRMVGGAIEPSRAQSYVAGVPSYRGGALFGPAALLSNFPSQVASAFPSQVAQPKTDAPAPTPSPASSTPQPEIQTATNAFSTFSLNVSDVSFKLAAASLANGKLPEAATVRSEEFINAFDYRDAGPAPGAPIGFAWDRAGYPFGHNRDLLRFAVKTAAQGRQANRPLNLVLLLDKSGSMERADRVAIIREALRVLGTELQPQDTISVVVFARTARLWADGLSGSQAGGLSAALEALTPEGGTNLEEAMKLAYETVLRHYRANGENRVVILTDGAANLGDVEPENLKKKVEANRAQGIALDCFGVGWDDFNDRLLEVLSRAGGGRYGFVNTPEEADSEFAGQLAGALRVAASDVKVQVEFNPSRVMSYRQIGYAKDKLTKEQFRDNTVKAAQLSVEEAGNALYTVELNPAGDGPICTVHVRYRTPGTQDYTEHAWDVPYNGAAAALDQASPAMRLAATASAFSEWLAASPYSGEVTLDQLQSTLRGVPEYYGVDARPKLLATMISEARSISGK